MNNIYDGAFRTIIEVSADVIQEIAQKYQKVREGVSGIMRGALIQTEARTILNQGINQAKREIALKILKRVSLQLKKLQNIQDLVP